MVRSRSSKPIQEPTDPAVESPPTRAAEPALPTPKAALVNAPGINSRDTDADPPGRLLPYGGKLPPLPDGYSAIITSIFDLPDPDAAYREVVAGIVPIKASRASMSELMDALDSAQAVALKARGLLVNTKASMDAVARDTQILVSAMRDQATSQLEREKESGLRKKAITEADVGQCLATMFPDEWSAVQERESKSRRSIDLIENMCERAVERARDLRAIIGASRSV